MFDYAKPVWLKNKRSTPNLQVGFRCDFDADADKRYILKITASTFYRVIINGRFAGYGPARAAHGYLRVDEIPLSVTPGKNKLAIEVAGYNCSSYYTLPVASFLCCELKENDAVIKYTGRDFNGLSLEKLRNMYAYRYSLQRAYSEVWNHDNSDMLTGWYTSDNLEFDKTYSFSICEEFIPRNLPVSDYTIITAAEISEFGFIKHKPYEIKNIRYVTRASNICDGYLPETVTDKTFFELYGDFIKRDRALNAGDTIHIAPDEYVIYKLPNNSTGFILNSIKALKDSSVFIFFSEYNYDNGMIFDALRANINIVKYNLKASDTNYELETFEPYTCQYIGIAAIEGEIEINPPAVREYCFPDCCNAQLTTDDDCITKIYEAAWKTFRQNTLDIYMDCPGRERGGWLCDSYFTAYSEKFFTGETTVENAFLNNFVMAKEFPNVPQGMLPMVYPSHPKKYNGGYIPQWAMWYIIELDEYLRMRGDDNVEKFRTLCYDLLEWFKKYENSDGLLESMPGWNFIEWSKANDWVQDVNYPTNMLYGKMLDVAGRLFNDDLLITKSKKVIKTVVEQSFDGEYFIDNAVRGEDGILRLTDNRSETCQYYAIFLGTADINDSKYETLYHKLLDFFGPERKKSGYMPEIEFSNAFIGNYLRIIILLRLKQFDKVLEDIKGYFLNMAELTGTLWEADELLKAQNGGSLNHGFASFAGVAAAYALSGISAINYNNKTIEIDKMYLASKNYELKIPVSDGYIYISQKDKIKTVDIPSSWSFK